MTGGVELEDRIRNVWAKPIHACYFCEPERYPAMPEKHTLCARCSALISIPVDDPRNLAMFVCPKCEIEIAEEVTDDARS